MGDELPAKSQQPMPITRLLNPTWRRGKINLAPPFHLDPPTSSPPPTNFLSPSPTFGAFCEVHWPAGTRERGAYSDAIPTTSRGEVVGATCRSPESLYCTRVVVRVHFNQNTTI